MAYSMCLVFYSKYHLASSFPVGQFTSQHSASISCIRRPLSDKLQAPSSNFSVSRRNHRYFVTRGAVTGWLASRTLDPRNPGRSVTRACVPGKNTLPLIARVFSDRTLKIEGPFYLVSMPGEVKDPTLVIQM